MNWQAGKVWAVSSLSAFGVCFLTDGKRVAVACGDYSDPRRDGALHLLDGRTGAVTPLNYSGPG